MMRRPARQRGVLLLIVIAGVVLLVLGLFAAWYLINFRDPPPSAEVTRALEIRHDSVPPQDNLFFAVLAFGSSSPGNLNEQGQAIHAANLARQAAGLSATSTLGGGLQTDRSLLCGAPGRPEECIERALANPDRLRNMITAESRLLDHYVSLKAYTQFQDPTRFTFDSPIPSWAPFIIGKRLYLTDIALQVGAGQIDQAIAALTADLRFTRQMLAQPDMLLIDKMILAASLRDSLGVLSDLVRTQTLSDAQYAQLNSAVGPLTQEERSLVMPLSREFGAFASMLHELTTPTAHTPGATGSHFLKYGATLNEAWQFSSDLQSLSRSSCRQFLAPAQVVHSRSALVFTDLIYNPIGNSLAKAASTGGLEYIRSMCDMEGIIKIVALQLQLRLQHVADEQFVAFVGHAGPDYANPFTGGPLHADPVRKTITFEPFADRDRAYLPWPTGAWRAGAEHAP